MIVEMTEINAPPRTWGSNTIHHKIINVKISKKMNENFGKIKELSQAYQSLITNKYIKAKRRDVKK